MAEKKNCLLHLLHTGCTRYNYHRLGIHSLASKGCREAGLVAMEGGESKLSVLMMTTNLGGKSDLPEAKT